MPQFTYTGSETKVFPGLSNPDGTTLEVKPGDTVTLDADPQIPDFAPTAAPKAAPVPAAATPEAPQTAPEAPTTPATPAA
jgi:hypothetical protein